MTRLPEVRDELVAAAARRAAGSGAARGARRSALIAAVLALLVAGTAAAALVATGVVGGAPSVPFARVEGEEALGMRRTAAPVVLGVATLGGGRRVEVVGYRMRGLRGRGELLCIDLLVLPDGRRSGGCADGPPGRATGMTGLGSVEAPGPVLATGATRAAVRSVAVRFRGGRRPATLVPVTPRLAARLRTVPFTFYVAELPPGARPVSATARAPDGAVAWRARFFAR
jgi:hypothetical protein